MPMKFDFPLRVKSVIACNWRRNNHFFILGNEQESDSTLMIARCLLIVNLASLNYLLGFSAL